MSRHDFAVKEFAARQQRARDAIGAAGLDWLLVIHPVSMRWLIGQDTKSYTVFQCIAVSARPSPLVLFTRGTDRNEYEADSLADEIVTYGGGEPADPMQHFSDFVAQRGLTRARVGMEVPGFYLHPQHYVRLRQILGDALVAEPNNLIGALRAVKSAQEIVYIRKAAALSAAALQALLATVAVGRSELELAAAAYHSLLSNDGGTPHSTMNLMTGERTAFALGAATERRLRMGDPGLVEIGGNYRRYTSTLGRQWSLGKPSARLVDLYGVVRQAADACMAAMCAGAPAVAGHAAARQVVAAAGLDRYRMHTTGYGIAPGFPPSWGDGVNMFGGSTDVLAAGMVVSIEPNIFIAEEKIGVRIIDNVLVTDTGVELLSTTARDLFVIE
jgi:Xaa-Pro dipeptidase